MRKEYNSRHDAPLVNPGITLEEYEAKRVGPSVPSDCHPAKPANWNGQCAACVRSAAHKARSLFIPTINGEVVA